MMRASRDESIDDESRRGKPMNRWMQYTAGSILSIAAASGVALAQTAAASGVALAQTAPPAKTLVLAGHSDEVPVVDLNGHSYVNLESLARLTGGALSFKGNQITLTLPAPPTAKPAEGLSKDFLRASIEEEALIREWRSALASSIQIGYPVTEAWTSTYRGRATEGLRLVSIVASTNDDRAALDLLKNELNIMQQLNDRYVAANQSHTYTPTDALSSDPLFQQVMDCKNALAAIWASGRVEDGASACR